MLFAALFLLIVSIITISQSAVLQYDSQIINGEDVAPGEIPYQVSLQNRKTSSHFCGGSILNEYYVITAAHCVKNRIPADITIVVGTVNLNRSGVSRIIRQIISHEKYDPDNSWLNDIALIQVFTPFKPSSYIGFVTLPKQDEIVQQGTAARVSGFGRLSEDGPGSKILQRATIYIVDQEYCKNMYNKILYNIYDSQICANNPNISKGSCKGDSGGPLIANEKLVGLVSWAKGCSLTDYPTVYTRIPSYIDWIEKNAV
ncbi:mite allergen Der p 3-like [Nylanderia fulva]|uniref:mite allergen Der p 3-like n=1 Tax=Nylanderia fulva TaxID=613905 RepID=UPI0010FB77F4|nr:mite allergen Der p 3-like [Nylanderia fulva]